jgi:TonB-linked SusC/RagA family outer membrane protein
MTGLSIYKTILRIMKLTAIILLVGFLQVSARTAAQERISISLKSAPLEKVFAEIEKRSGYNVFFNVEVLKYSGPITIDMKDAAIDDVMHYCLKGLPLAFTIQDKTIFVKHDNHTTTLDSPTGPGDTPPPTVSGIVRSEKGAPLAGASIYIPKLKKSGLTNEKGEFSLKGVPDGQYDIEITYVGFEPFRSKITVENRTANFTASLKQSTSKLDESVVIAYGNTTQRLSTGDVTKVTSKEIEQQPVSNPLEALEGRVPGLLITQNNGLPGGSFTVQIRGQNSIAQGNDPFYVIDGVPYISELPASPLNVSLQGGSPLNFINPYDIESIEVLKDADATAIYGSRAANGAILITTKKGKEGTMKFDVNFKSGFTNPARTIPLMQTPQYLAMREKAFSNDGVSPIPSYAYDVNGTWDTTRNDNWPKALANKLAEFTDAETSVSGGTANIQYLIGGGYMIQKTGFPTILPGDGGDRKGSGHFSINGSSPDKKFKIFLTGSFVADKNTVQSNDFTGEALILAPDAPPIYNPDGSLNWAPLAPGQTGTWTNPFAYLYQKYVSSTTNLVSNAGLNYAVAKGLECRVSLGYANTQTNETQTSPTTATDPGQHIESGTAYFNASYNHSWIVEPQVEYHLQLGKGTFDVLTGATFQQQNTSVVNTSASGFVSDALLQDIQAASKASVLSNASQNNYEAIFGRLSYNWMDKYIVDLTARRDGTSSFGPGKQFGNFGAVGAAWIFTKENFFQHNLGLLSFGKLRASYGTTGNNQVGPYQFIDTYSPTSFPYGNSQGLSPINLANPLLAWETTKKLEGGLELGFLKDRIILQASIYRNRSGNELVQTPISAVTGFQTISSNLPALVQNAGQEFVISTVNIKAKNFSWSSSLNLSTLKNKLLKYPNLANSPYTNSLVLGQPLTVEKLWHEIGVNDTTGLYQFASKGGSTYNPDALTDRTVLLNRMPKFYGGIRNSFSFKSFTLDIFFQFVEQTGRRFWAAYNYLPGTQHNMPSRISKNTWQNPGDQKSYQQFTESYGSEAANTYQYALGSDFAYGPASYIRLKNVALSWAMPQAWVKKSGLSCRLYLQCQNLWTITNYDGLDPETQSAATGPRRGCVAGIQLGL